MKRIVCRAALCLALSSLAASGARAQTRGGERRISFSTTLGIGIPMASPASTPLLWQVGGHYRISDRWAVGAGTGMSFYEATLVPLYGDVRYRIGRERRLTPYLECAAGYSFAPSNDAEGGLLLAPSVGVQMPLGGRLRLLLSAGYEMQKMSLLRSHADSHFSAEFVERLNHGSISLRVGVRF